MLAARLQAARPIASSRCQLRVDAVDRPMILPPVEKVRRRTSTRRPSGLSAAQPEPTTAILALKKVRSQFG